MRKVNIGRGEVVLADLNPSRRSTFGPVLWLLILTAGCFAILGVLDQFLDARARFHLGAELDLPVLLDGLVDPAVDRTIGIAVWARRVTVIIAVLLSWRLCFRHLVYRNRCRMVVTNQRMVVASGHVRSQVTEIPMARIAFAQAHRSTVNVHVHGMGRPLRLADVPHAKAVAKMLNARGGHYS